ncbi:MAG: hypothetical protein IJS96_10790 [Schwartzia sp.]|nr:hypothetical protein [Schwartzia sp. (in: firmicutes)]
MTHDVLVDAVPHRLLYGLGERLAAFLVLADAMDKIAVIMHRTAFPDDAKALVVVDVKDIDDGFQIKRRMVESIRETQALELRPDFLAVVEIEKIWSGKGDTALLVEKVLRDDRPIENAEIY